MPRDCSCPFQELAVAMASERQTGVDVARLIGWSPSPPPKMSAAEETVCTGVTCPRPAAQLTVGMVQPLRFFIKLLRKISSPPPPRTNSSNHPGCYGNASVPARNGRLAESTVSVCKITLLCCRAEGATPGEWGGRHQVPVNGKGGLLT